MQLVARNHESRTEVESFVQQVAHYARNHECPKGGESRSMRDSVVHQDARYNMK